MATGIIGNSGISSDGLNGTTSPSTAYLISGTCAAMCNLSAVYPLGATTLFETDKDIKFVMYPEYDATYNALPHPRFRATSSGTTVIMYSDRQWNIGGDPQVYLDLKVDIHKISVTYRKLAGLNETKYPLPSSLTYSTYIIIWF